MNEMSENDHPIIKVDWKFQKEYLKELTHVATTLNHYEVAVRKLGRLWQAMGEGVGIFSKCAISTRIWCIPFFCDVALLCTFN